MKHIIHNKSMYCFATKLIKCDIVRIYYNDGKSTVKHGKIIFINKNYKEGIIAFRAIMDHESKETQLFEIHELQQSNINNPVVFMEIIKTNRRRSWETLQVSECFFKNEKMKKINYGTIQTLIDNNEFQILEKIQFDEKGKPINSNNIRFGLSGFVDHDGVSSFVDYYDGMEEEITNIVSEHVI